MMYIGDIQFWFITSLNIVAVDLLISSARLKGKEWLLGFIITLERAVQTPHLSDEWAP